jgi:hypothetical protein
MDSEGRSCRRTSHMNMIAQLLHAHHPPRRISMPDRTNRSYRRRLGSSYFVAEAVIRSFSEKRAEHDAHRGESTTMPTINPGWSPAGSLEDPAQSCSTRKMMRRLDSVIVAASGSCSSDSSTLTPSSRRSSRETARCNSESCRSNRGVSRKRCSTRRSARWKGLLSHETKCLLRSRIRPFRSCRRRCTGLSSPPVHDPATTRCRTAVRRRSLAE